MCVVFWMVLGQRIELVVYLFWMLKKCLDLNFPFFFNERYKKLLAIPMVLPINAPVI